MTAFLVRISEESNAGASIPLNPMKHSSSGHQASPTTTTMKTGNWSTVDKTQTRKAQFHCRILTLSDIMFLLTYCTFLITLISLAPSVFCQMFFKYTESNLYKPCYLPLVVCSNVLYNAFVICY